MAMGVTGQTLFVFFDLGSVLPEFIFLDLLNFGFELLNSLLSPRRHQIRLKLVKHSEPYTKNNIIRQK